MNHQSKSGPGTFFTRYGALCALFVVGAALGITYYTTGRQNVPSPEASPLPQVTQYEIQKTSKPIPTPTPNVQEPEEEETQQTGLFDTRFSLICPAQGEIQRPFAMDHLIYQPTLAEYSTHSGIDIACIESQQIAAAADGQIAVIETDALWGNRVQILHQGGYVTWYMGLGSCDVEIGQNVKAGEILGKAGNSARCEVSQGTHLHFELLKDDKPLDPEEYFRS